MKQHELKCDPLPYFPLSQNHKRAELRLNDRDYKEGDLLHLRETRYSSTEMRFHNKPLEYTGRFCYRIISHVFPISEPAPPPPGYVLLSVRPLTKTEKANLKGS